MSAVSALCLSSRTGAAAMRCANRRQPPALQIPILAGITAVGPDRDGFLTGTLERGLAQALYAPIDEEV